MREVQNEEVYYAEYPKPRSRKWIYVVFIITIMIFAFIGRSIFIPEKTWKEPLNSEPWTNRRITRVDGIVNFSARFCEGDINKYFWDFGDGYTSTIKDPTHSFDQPGWYNVSLKITDYDGNSDEGNLIMGIQPNNQYSYIQEGTVWVTESDESHWMSTSISIGPNIDQPEVHIYVDITQPTGDFTIRGHMQVDIDNSNKITKKMFSYNYTDVITNKDIYYSNTIQQTEFPQEV
jgi:hypothetical protein